LRTPVAQRIRALLCDGRGRWFDSSRAYHFADVAQTEEHRASTPERPVRFGSSALEGPWCKREHGELQPRWSGFDPLAGLLEQDSSRAEAVRLSGRSGSTPQRTAPARPRRLSCCGPEGFRLSVAGSNPVRSTSRSGSSVRLERPVRVSFTTAADVRANRGPKKIGYLHPEQGRPRTSARPSAGSPPDLHLTTAAPRTAGRSTDGYRESTRR
jgi:hypothetical protein